MKEVIEWPENFVNEVRRVTELVELRDRARKAIPEASAALFKFFEDYAAGARAALAAEAKSYAEEAAKKEAAALAKHRDEVKKAKVAE